MEIVNSDEGEVCKKQTFTTLMEQIYTTVICMQRWLTTQQQSRFFIIYSELDVQSEDGNIRQQF